MKLTLTVCDVCQERDAPTKEYEIRSGSQKVKVELCEAHGQPFEAYLQRDTARPATPRAGSVRRVTGPASPAARRSRVTTLAEIEESKKKK